ncbi:MAG: ATP-binding protein [Coriobacteriia bacterium]|nr:ATP-binding protein [Coriobacteriia bacterium]
MLLNLTIENWMSYRDEATLNLTSSRERQHMETLAKMPGFRSMKALPVAAVYGGNASGKTGVFRALACLKRMVISDAGINGVLPVSPFMLERETALKPSVFDITFLANKTVYRYVVEATLDGVRYESLEKISERGAVDIFERDTERNEPYLLNTSFFAQSDHVAYAAKSTRLNQLFLGSAVAQNVIELEEAYGWFSSTLNLVGVESQAFSFATCAVEKEGFLQYAADVLSRLDTGIVNLTTESANLDMLPQDAELRKTIAELDPGSLVTFVSERAAGDYGFEVVTVRKDESHPVAERLRTIHIGPDGNEHSFPLSAESSGTQRLMGLLPMLFDLINQSGSIGEKVYVVDELDRCLHTMLTKRLIEEFTASCDAETRKQLLFTTHDLLLMDQSLMRRDEMYIAQRDADGCSELIGLAEFNGIRFDRDLVRSYLDGRFGGIPMLGEADARG